jgi:hypothetical protein
VIPLLLSLDPQLSSLSPRSTVGAGFFWGLCFLPAFRREDVVFFGSNLQDIHNELYMEPMVLEVASRWGTVNVIELLAPIDIGKGAVKKA